MVDRMNLLIDLLRQGINSSMVWLLGESHPNISIITEIGFAIVFLFAVSMVVGLFIYFSVSTFYCVYSLLISSKVNILLDWVLRTKISSLISSFFSQLPTVKHTHFEQMVYITSALYFSQGVFWLLTYVSPDILPNLQDIYAQSYDCVNDKSVELPEKVVEELSEPPKPKSSADEEWADKQFWRLMTVVSVVLVVVVLVDKT